MKFLGFDNDDEDDYENNDSYNDERSRKNKSKHPANSNGRLILFKGIADEVEKRRLCEAYNEGAMILIDMHDLNRSEYDEAGKDFITFMGGVAYAHSGEMKHIKPAQYLLTPRGGIFEVWPEGESADE